MAAIDILYYTLAGSVLVLTIFISMTMIYLMFILRDVTKIADKVREIADKVDRYITKPILMTRSIVDFLSPFISTAENAFKGKRKNK